MTAPIRVLELRSVRGTGGGPEKTILMGAARTDPSRFDVTICYLRDARDPVFEIDTRAAGLPVAYVDLLERHSFDPSIWPRLRRLVKERRIDIVHSHDYKTNLLAWLLARIDGTTVLSTVHGWTGQTWRERAVYYPADKRVLAGFSKLIAVSEDIRHELIRHGALPGHVVTVLNGIDHLAFRRDPSRCPAQRHALGLSQTDVVLGAVGRLEPQKRFDLLIDAFAELRATRPHLKLLIVGDGRLRTVLQEQIATLKLDEACRLLGHRNDIGDLHHAFNLFVQSSDYEGTPNAVLEAMALETPVVATDVGGTSQLLRSGVDGVVIPAGSRNALVEAVHSTLEQRESAAVRARSARRRIETELSFDARMAALDAIYTELVQASGRASSAPVVPLRT